MAIDCMYVTIHAVGVHRASGAKAEGGVKDSRALAAKAAAFKCKDFTCGGWIGNNIEIRINRGQKSEALICRGLLVVIQLVVDIGLNINHIAKNGKLIHEDLNLDGLSGVVLLHLVNEVRIAC